MGVKSTVRLTREDAEQRYVTMYYERKKLYEKALAKAKKLSNTELEDKLEKFNDARYADGRGGFDNYLIVEAHNLED